MLRQHAMRSTMKITACHDISWEVAFLRHHLVPFQSVPSGSTTPTTMASLSSPLDSTPSTCPIASSQRASRSTMVSPTPSCGYAHTPQPLEQPAAYFPIMMGPAGQTWLTGLVPCSIDSWRDLCDRFIANFQATCTEQATSYDLALVTQKPGESLRDYTRRFFDVRNKIAHVDDRDIIQYFRLGLDNRKLWCRMFTETPSSAEQMMELMLRHAAMQEAERAKWRDDRQCLDNHLDATTIHQQTTRLTGATTLEDIAIASGR